MATYDLIVGAGNVDKQNVLKFTFATHDCSDIAQLTAWDDHNMTTVNKELVKGVGAPWDSYYCAISTDAGTSGVNWVAGCVSVVGGSLKNRLKGDTNYVLLGAAAPAAGDSKLFNMAVEIPSTATAQSDSVAIAVKYFYTGTEPVVTLTANSNVGGGTEGVPVWANVVLLYKGAAGPAAFPSKLIPTGPNSVASPGYLDPITRPGAGVHIAEEYYVQLT